MFVNIFNLRSIFNLGNSFELFIIIDWPIIRSVFLDWLIRFSWKIQFIQEPRLWFLVYSRYTCKGLNRCWDFNHFSRDWSVLCKKLFQRSRPECGRLKTVDFNDCCSSACAENGSRLKYRGIPETKMNNRSYKALILHWASTIARPKKSHILSTMALSACYRSMVIFSQTSRRPVFKQSYSLHCTRSDKFLIMRPGK